VECAVVITGKRLIDLPWLYLDLGSACGVIILNKDGIVVDGAPYFLKFLRGKHLLTELKDRYYRLESI